LVAEAEKEVKKEYNRKNKRKKMTDSTPVDPPGECLSADTFVWLANSRRVQAVNIKSNQIIETPGGPMRIVRTDRCRSSLIEIVVLGSSVALAPFHRVLTAYGYFMRADRRKPGHEVMTKSGKAAIAEIKSYRKIESVYNFGVGKKSACRVGPAGIWVEVADTGPPVTRTETVFPHQLQGN